MDEPPTTAAPIPGCCVTNNVVENQLPPIPSNSVIQVHQSSSNIQTDSSSAVTTERAGPTAKMSSDIEKATSFASASSFTGRTAAAAGGRPAANAKNPTTVMTTAKRTTAKASMSQSQSQIPSTQLSSKVGKVIINSLLSLVYKMNKFSLEIPYF